MEEGIADFGEFDLQYSQHGQATVIDLRQESTFFDFGLHVFGKSKRIVQIEWDGVRDVIKGWVLARLTTLRVMGETRFRRFSRCQFGIKFQKSNEEDDLGLGFKRQSVPLFRWRQVCRWERRPIQCHGPREVKVALNAIAN